MSMPSDLFNTFPAPTDGFSHGRSGDVSIPKLLELVKHHKLRKAKVASENFGLIDLPLKDVIHRVEGMVGKVAAFEGRVLDMQGEVCVVKASIYLQPIRDVKIEAWEVWIHHIRGVVEGSDHNWRFYG
jgi:hypothetical protein